ncbi:UNVERIFIED_CONTAM: hypothetical protein H355_015440 [Colinus virginianus]|nr:hypothetical protein H355_015440 [Colinus virginianus]
MAAPRWAPTHVQVTVLRARGLRSKAADGHGGSDAYALMAVGRDKFSTSVAERCQGSPEWREEATFELPPPPRPAALRLTVLHRSLVGLDKFLGRAEVDLAALREDGGRRHSRWYKLRSKPGKKEKERGEIEVDIQFMRSNMTASMFDLSVKDKSRSAFGKLKDKLKGKRSSGHSDTASAIVPSTTHSPADSEDEAAEKEKKKSKFRALFSKPGLQKTSLSQSIKQQRNLEFLPVYFFPGTFEIPLEEKSSPSLLKHRKAATLDSRQLNPPTAGNAKKEGLSLFSGLKPKSDPVSKSSLCINGSHVYMEENTLKDSTPASSPSPRNFRKKQIFASEENLSSRSKGPEEMGRAPPSTALSGSASLETFKAMSLPSYKLLRSEEHVESSIPVSAEVTKEPKKTDQKKAALLSLVTGKKEAARSSDAESGADRAQKEEENRAAEEKSERPEPPADVRRGNPSDVHPEVFTSQQPLSPSEQEQKPERAAAPAKTKAVKPRLGVSSEEETKATLPTFAPDSLPAYLSVHHISSDNNPFISKTGQKVPDSESTASASPPFTAELLSGKNPFNPSWDRLSPATGSEHVAIPSSHRLAASAPQGQVSGRGNNPFASEWGQDPGSSSCGVSPLPTASLRSGGHFNGSNPFISRTGWGVDTPGLTAVAASSPGGLPGDEDNSSAGLAADLSCSAATASRSSSLTRNVADPPGTPSDSPGVAPKNQCDSAQVQVDPSLNRSELELFPENGAEQPPCSDSELKEKQEEWSEKGREEHSPTSEPQEAPGKNQSSFPVGSVKPALGAAAGGAGREGAGTPQPAPRLSLRQKCPPVSQADELSVGPSGEGEGSVFGLPFQNEKAPGARGCLPHSGSATALPPPAKLRADSSSRHVKEGDEDLFDSLADPKSALPAAGDHSVRLAALPAIPEAGSDDELQGDSQENHAAAAAGQNVSESVGRTPLCEEQEGSDSSAADGVSQSAGGGSAPVLPAGGHGPGVSNQTPDSGLTSHSSEHSRCFEKQIISTGVGEHAESDCFEPSVSSSSLSCSSQRCSSFCSLSSDTSSQRAESPKKPTAEGRADKAENSGKKKLLQAWVSPSETYPNQTQQSGETVSPKHRLHPVKPMNATANKSQSKDLNVISTVNEKLLEMSIKKYNPSDPAYAYAQLTHDELIQLVLKQKDTITKKDLQVRELEDYIDNLLVRVMEETPNILRVSTSGNRKAGKM